MNLLWIFVPAATILVSATTGLAGSPEPPVGAMACSGCHPVGSGVETSVPRLAGRKAEEIVAQMRAFRSGQRSATVMDRIAKGYSDAEGSEVYSSYDWHSFFLVLVCDSEIVYSGSFLATWESVVNREELCG